MIYKGYLIEQDLTGYAPKHLKFNFFNDDGETHIGSGESIEDIKEKLEYNYGWENLDCKDKKWFVDELILDIHNICTSN